MASTTLQVSGAAVGTDDRVDAAPRRLPVAVLAATGLAVLEALALVALGLTGLGSVLESSGSPPGPLAALLLFGLAGWAVAAAGGGLVLADGSGGRLLSGLAYAELGVLVLALLLGLTTTALDGSAGAPPLLLLVLLVFPVGKLVLVNAPSTAAWLAAGPRPPRPRPALTEQQRVLRGVTVGVIGLLLVTVALVSPAEDRGATVSPAPASPAPASQD